MSKKASNKEMPSRSLEIPIHFTWKGIKQQEIQQLLKIMKARGYKNLNVFMADLLRERLKK